MLIHPQVIFDFNKNSTLDNWRIIDDEVMGGKSSSEFFLSKEGNGIFTGEVSLENNGGFCLLRFNADKVEVKNYSKVQLHLKGDGKDYQFRIKDKSSNEASYIQPFETNGEWQTVEIELSSLYPSFRGRRLRQSNFNATSFEELFFFIGNKKNERFTLEIDKIVLI